MRSTKTTMMTMVMKNMMTHIMITMVMKIEDIQLVILNMVRL